MSLGQDQTLDYTCKTQKDGIAWTIAQHVNAPMNLKKEVSAPRNILKAPSIA